MFVDGLVECIDDGDEGPVDVGAGGDGGDGERAMIVDCVDVLVYVCEFDATDDVVVPVECLDDVCNVCIGSILGGEGSFVGGQG